ncbi:MAG: PadR family transcriptional regulator [Rhizobiales bacterium 68-8]|jgi:DNA-binding PadR family transcriptional regulator|nr:MAG: PadR family transcriptional regulator [Rhizobiales bacterium 68-8]
MFHDQDRHDHAGRGCGPRWHMKGRGGGEHFGRGGPGGPFGRHRGGPFGGRGGRMFDPGALRLVVLGLIAEEPRHGYDIIKALEAKFQGAYSPSPGAIYPMLQMLEEADLVVSQADGNKRLFSITEQGRAYLEENRADLDRINEQVQHVAGRMGGAAIGDELRALAWAIRSKLRGGGWSAEQAQKARDILKTARRELEDL